MILIELPIGQVELRIVTQDRVEVYYMHEESEFKISDEVNLRDDSDEPQWH